MQKTIKRLSKKTVSILMAMLLVFTSVSVAMPAVFALTPAQAASNYNSNASANNTFNLALTLAQNINSYVSVWNGTFSHSGNSYNTGSGNALGQFKTNVRNAFSGNAGTTAAGWFGSKTGENYCPSSPYSSNTTDAFGGTDGSADEPSHALQSGHNNRTWNEDITVSKSRSVADALSGDYANNPLGVPTSVVTGVSMTLYLSGKSDCNHYDSDGGWGHHRHVVEFWYFRQAASYSTSSSNTNYPLTQVQNLKAALDAANKTQSNYTSASWSTYSSARSTAQNMWNAIYANPYTAIGTYGSTTIQNAATALNNAIAGLQTTVTLNGNGGTPTASSVAVTVGSGTTGNFPAGSYSASRSDGYSFNGWSTSSSATSGTASGNISVGFNATLYATWTPTNYTITYNTNGGTAIAAKTYNRTSTDTLPAASGKAGYSFSTWKPAANSGTWSASSTYNSGTSLNGKYGNVTLNAQWSPVGYTITYDANGGSVSPGTLSYNIESTSTLATPSKTGYSFAGWKPSAAAGNWNASTTYAAGASVKNMYGNVTLVAQWNINQYTLTVNPNGGTFNNSTANSSFTQNYQSTKTIDDATRTAYTFSGWTLSGSGSWNGSNKTYTFGAGAGTLTAGWTPINYTITYNANGGSVDSATLGYNIEATSKLATPFREGYTFTGWKPSADAGNWSASSTYAAGSAVTGKYGDVTLVAQWQINQYTLTVDPNGGSWGGSTTNATFTQDYQSTKEIADPSRTGYTFTAWTLSGAGSFDTSSKTFTYGAGASTLKAGWNANIYTVQFDGNGATSGSTASFYKTYEINATIPANGFEKIGYTFQGWSTGANGEKVYGDGAVMSNDLSTVSGDTVTLYAVWEAIPYTVEIDLNSTDPLTTYSGPTGGIYEETITLADPVRPGYTFTGWTLISGSGTLSGSDYTFGPDNAKVRANWSAISYTLTLDANEGVVDPSTITGIIYDEVDVPDPYREGYDFTGWTKVSGKGTYANSKFTFSDDDAQLQAGWEAIIYNVGIDFNCIDEFGNDCSEDITFYEDMPGGCIIGDEVPLGEPTRTGYNFVRWELVSGNGTLENNVYTVRSSDAEIKAIWEAIPYTLTLDTNGGELAEGVSNQITSIIYGTADVPTPTREGYIFLDWEMVEGSKGMYADTRFHFEDGDATLKAQWQAIPYTLTVDLGCEDPTANYSGTVAESYIFLDTVEIPDPTRTGYDFAGWTITSDKAGSFIDKVYTFSSADVTFTATWTAHTYHIAFDINNALATADDVKNMDAVDATFDTAQNLPANEFTVFGYTFKGWALTSDGEKAYDDGAEVINLTTDKDVTVTLYALWSPNQHEMTIEPYVTMELGVEPQMYYNGDLAPITFEGIIYDEITLGVPECEGYTFERWAIKEGCETGATLTKLSAYQWKFTFSNDDPVLVAVFTPKPFELTVNAIGDTPAAHESDVAYTGETSYMKFFTQTVTVPSPTRVGYEFTGWELKNNSYAPETFTAGSFSGTTYTFGSWGQKATATWSPITYNITIDLNATDKFGNDCSADITYAGCTTEGIIYDVVDLGAPTRDGYTFSGWELVAGDGTVNNEDNSFVFTASDATIKATWTEIPYTVDIVVTDGSYAAEYSGEPGVTGVNHEVVSLGTATRRGYDFVRWDLTGKGTIDGSTFTFGDGNATLTAVWEAQRYTIKVNLNKNTKKYPIARYGDVDYDGALKYTDQIIFDEIDLGDAPERYGFTFKGWTAKVGAIREDGKTYVVDNGDATITAKWSINKYKVRFIDAELDKTDEYKVTFMDSVTAPEKKEFVPIDVDLSYHFLGWTADGDFTVNGDGVVKDVSRDLTFTAIYETVGHVWGDWQFDNLGTHYRVCQDCGYKDEHVHQWDSSEVTIEPTCYLTGVEVFTCSVCGAKGAVSIDALGHDWGEWTPVPGDEADCEHGGSEHRFCSRCGLEDTKKVIKQCHNLPNAVLGEGYCTHCGKFVCTSCDQFDVLEQVPGIGTLYKIIHFFIHTFHQIQYHT